MPNKSPNAALAAALSGLRRAGGCITERPLIATGYRASPRPHYVGFAPPGRSVPLHTVRGRRHMRLLIKIDYVVELVDDRSGGYDIRTTSYAYQVLDHEDREILAYHLHPAGVSPITFPHLHLCGRLTPLDLGPGVEPAALGDMHLPTGVVTLADVVRLLIDEFDITPRRADWDAVLRSDRDPFAAR